MILFVDDERRRMSGYLEACEFAGFVVSLVESVDEAWEQLVGRPESVDALLLDVMMPLGNRFAERPDALMGMRTGLVLYTEIRKTNPSLPIILLTQSNDREIDLAVRNDQHTVVVRKQSILPADLPGVLGEILGAAR